jgi:hypothetical protein
MDPDVRFTTPTTRRTIVATGAKLAYAAPLVAASMALPAAAAAQADPRDEAACGCYDPALGFKYANRGGAC